LKKLAKHGHLISVLTRTKHQQILKPLLKRLTLTILRGVSKLTTVISSEALVNL